MVSYWPREADGLVAVMQLVSTGICWPVALVEKLNIFADLPLVINVLISTSCLRLNNQILQNFEIYCINMLLSLPEHLRVINFAYSDCLAKCDKRFMVEAHRRSTKHPRFVS